MGGGGMFIQNYLEGIDRKQSIQYDKNLPSVNWFLACFQQLKETNLHSFEN